jgi:5-methylcytosine-specific restriction endonuclease McrA
MGQNFRQRRPAAPTKTVAEAEELVRRMRAVQEKGSNYREKSLKLNGWICARCGREFELSNLHLLTVHHKDGNHTNNPADGSNWENLCSYCHDDEHSRGLLGDYLSDRK